MEGRDGTRKMLVCIVLYNTTESTDTTVHRPRHKTPIGWMSNQNLKRDTTTLAVLNKDSTINESFVQVLLLEASIGNIISASGLLEDTDLVLSLTTQVARDELSSRLKTLAALGVVHLDSAVSVSYALCSLK